MKTGNNFKSQEIRNKLGAKKSFFSLPDEIKDSFGIILTVAVAFVGTYLYLPWHGIVSSIPFVVICAFGCAFFKANEILKAAIFFITPFSVSLLLGEKVPYALELGVFCAVFYILAYSSVSLFKKGKINFKIASVFLLVLSLALHIFANSTPWSVSENNKLMSKYIRENYSGEPLYATDVKFDSFDRTYTLSLIPHHNAGTELDVVMKDGKIIKDEYVDYSEKYNMLVGAGQITYVIRKMHPELKFTVESDNIYGYPFSAPATTVPTMDYSRFMDFSVYFSSYNDAKSFTALAEECYRALITSGFYCRTITFYGGTGTRYIAKISVPFNSMTGNLEGFVEPCDNDIFLYTSLK